MQIVTAQNKPTKDETKKSNVFEVHLPILVIDKRKKLVSGLTLEDFIVLENGKRQKIAVFHDEKNSSPVYVGVLMDTSPSMQKKLGFVKDGAKSLVYSITRLRKDKAAFLTFDNEIKLRQDFTDKIDLLDTAIDIVKENGQRNSLYDAIYQFCDEKLQNASGRRAIVVISDGKDSFSRAKLKDAIEIAQRTETVVYIISTNDNSSASTQNFKKRKIKNTNDDFLLKLTAEISGVTLFVNDLLSLEKAVVEILKDIRSQYIFTYRPINQKYDGKERKIKVRFENGKKGKVYKIRTKTKYRVLRSVVK